MKIAETQSNLLGQIEALKIENPNAKIGFVPTMGALHEGHLSLIEKAATQCEIVVVSIFVNPTQFNNKEDLLKYPRTLEADVELLNTSDCTILFSPDYEEVYPKNVDLIDIDLNGLDEVMEGAFRPDHFKGVVTVVYRLFDLVKPDVAFFGKKDFQQLAIILQMVKIMNLDVEIVPVDIKRAETGLALSSRNVRLSDYQATDALIIFKTLSKGKELVKIESNLSQVKSQMVSTFNSGNLILEYLEIVNPITLQAPADSDKKMVCCIAAHCGEVRLIDNMEFTRD